MKKDTDKTETSGMASKLNGVLCALGWHRPLRGHRHNFIDKVSGDTVYNAECPCGKKWMVDSPFSFFGCKVERT